MKSNFFSRNRINFFLLAALVVYNDLFYHERLGLNLLLYTVLIFIMLVILYPSHLRSPRTMMSGALTLMLAVVMTWHNSVLGWWMFFLSFFTTIGFVIQPRLRFPALAWLTGMDNIIKLPLEILYWNREQANSKRLKLSRMITIALVPFVIAIIFFMIYRAANPVFDELSKRFMDKIGVWIDRIFETISFPWLVFIVAGIFIISGILYHRRPARILREEEKMSDDIVRRRKTFRMPYLKMDFRIEYLGGILLLVMVNLMLLALNLIDIQYIWINFKIPEGVSLTEMVHQGTEWLIASIILSMLVLIWLFRANQNFYSRSGILKILAYTWIAQNMILTISLLLRNNQYIAWHALAYKRLGVYVFIFLTFCGLVSMIIKISKAKSFFFLLRVNSWIAYFVLSLICLVNWDVFIARYNIHSNTGAGLDTDFLLELSPKVLPYIYQDWDHVAEQIKAHPVDSFNHLTYKTPEEFREALDKRRDRYLATHSEYTWRSYNSADHYAIEYLKANK
jgi:hypothetical protein